MFAVCSGRMMTVPNEATGHRVKEHPMKTQQHGLTEPTRTTEPTGFKRRLAIGLVALGALVSVALPNAAAADSQTLASNGTTRLPPGWCYSETIGTYDCRFVIKFPFP
jgi:hypothetical protein